MHAAPLLGEAGGLAPLEDLLGATWPAAPPREREPGLPSPLCLCVVGGFFTKGRVTWTPSFSAVAAPSTKATPREGPGTGEHVSGECGLP